MPLELDQVTTLARALEIRDGQVWRRDEKRFRGRRRYVRVEFICRGGRRVRVQGCKIDGTAPKGAKSTEVDTSRFNRRGGFLPVAPGQSTTTEKS